MATFKNALTELQEQVELSYVDLEKQGEDLENAIEVFADIAAIKEDICLGECVTNYNSKPTYVLPVLPNPTGSIVWGNPTKTTNSISQPFSYTGTDATHYLGKVDGVAIGNVTTPINLTGLTASTAYLISVTPVNAFGLLGIEASTTVTTLASSGGGGGGSGGGGGGAAPLGLITFLTPTVGVTTILQPFSYNGIDATHFTATLDGVSIGTVVSPIDLSGLIADTAYLIEVTPVNIIGNGTPADTTVTTLEDTAPIGVINFTGGAFTFNNTTRRFDYTENFVYVGTDTVTDFLIELDTSTVATLANVDNTGVAELVSLLSETEYTLKVTPLNAGVAGNTATLVFTTPESSLLSVLRPLIFEFYYLYEYTDESLLPLGYLYNPSISDNPDPDFPSEHYIDTQRIFNFKIDDIYTTTVDLRNTTETVSTYPPSNAGSWLGSPFSRYHKIQIPDAIIDEMVRIDEENPSHEFNVYIQPVTPLTGALRNIPRFVLRFTGGSNVDHLLIAFFDDLDERNMYIYPILA
jgi:hypothetical protein